MARVFISHSSRDAELAAGMKTWLQEQGFAAPFLDFDKHAGIPPGADWEKTLYRELESSEAVLIIQTANWLESKWCFAEFTQARALGKPIFPVVDAPDGKARIAPDIQALDLGVDRAGGLAQLARALTSIALDAQGGFTWDPARPPYPGLLAFQEEDAAVYFGRDEDIRHLMERLNARRTQGGVRLIAVLGASGSGKSSLLRAGVIPRLKRDHRNWVVMPPMRPQLHPIDELARVMAIGLGQHAEWRRFRDDLESKDAPSTLSEWVHDVRMAAGSHDAQVLLSIDQAEELFTMADRGQAQRFSEILAGGLSGPLPILAVMALRSDFLEALQRSDTLGSQFEEFSLRPLPLTCIPHIIEGPARVAGLSVDDGLVLEASREAATEDALPLLAFALRELNDRYGSDGRLRLEDYRALGDAKEGLSPLENAVRKAADGVIAAAQPSEEELKALRQSFVPALVRVNDAGEYVRRPAAWDTLPPAARGLLERLVAGRLIVRRHDGEASVVEVAHEALLRKWPRLRGWLDEERAFLIGKQQLEEDLRDWQSVSDTDKNGALLTGLKLSRAQGWLAERPEQLSRDERRFVQASLKRTTWRRRIAQTSIVAGLCIAVALSTVALLQYRERDRQAEVAFANQLLNRAEALRDTDVHKDGLRSAAQALSALDRLGEITFDADQSVRKSYAQLAKWTDTGFGRHSVTTSAVAADGRFVALYTYGSEFVLVDSVTGEIRAACPYELQPDATRGGIPISVSADGSRVAFSIFGGTNDRSWNRLGVWSFADCKVVLEEELEDDRRSAVRGFELNSDGSALLVLMRDGLHRWDLASGTMRRVDGGIRMMSFAASPDGRRYAAYELAQGERTHWIRIRSVDSGELEREWQVPDRIESLTWGQSGLLVKGGGYTLYDPDGKVVLRSRDISGQQVVLSPDGRYFAARCSPPQCDSTIEVWDANTNTLVARSQRTANNLAFAPDGRSVVALSTDRLGVWHFSEGGPYAVLDSGGHATHIWFSEDSSQLRASDDRGEASWQLPAAGAYMAPVLMENTLDKDRRPQLSTGDKLAVPEGERLVLAEAVDRSGRRAVIIAGRSLRGGQERTLEVWEGGEKIAEQPYDPVLDDNRAAFLQFAGQGRFLVIGTRTGLEMVDAITLAPVATLYHTGAILAGAQMDGLRAVTMDHRQSIRMWETATGREVARLAATRPASALELSSDGRWLAALTPGRQIDLWAIAPDDVVAQACRWLDDPCP